MANMSNRALPVRAGSSEKAESVDLAEMEKILQEMLEKDEDITARAVIKRHSTLRHASTITRSAKRKELLTRYQEKQDELRVWRQRLVKRSRDSTAMDMAEKDVLIGELKRQVELLTASHVAMIRLVGEFGGYTKWAQFFVGYKGVLEMLTSMGAMPRADVKTITKAPRSRRNE